MSKFCDLHRYVPMFPAGRVVPPYGCPCVGRDDSGAPDDRGCGPEVDHFAPLALSMVRIPTAMLTATQLRMGR